MAAVVDGAPLVIRPGRLVLALPPHAVPEPIPGWAMAGVVGLDALEEVAGRVVLAGSGAGLLRAAGRLLERGCTLAAVVLTGPAAGMGQRQRVARLRRAGVPVLTGTALGRALGGSRFRALLLADGRRIEAGWCVLHGGWAPESGLARALGVRCRVETPGVLVPETGPGGVTNVSGVFVLAGPAGVGRWPAAEPTAFADADLVCRCEGVDAGAVRRALAAGALSLPGVKRATRAGMGRCQGRLCGMTLHALCGGGGEARHLAPRAPLTPLRAGLLARREQIEAPPLSAPPVTRWLTVATVAAPRAAVAAPGSAPAAFGSAEVVVIGAGVVGLVAALHLAREGREVLVLDRGEPGLGASTANAGSLHVQLLPEAFGAAGPGPLGEALALGPASIALWRALAAEAGEGLGLRTEGGLILAADEADMAWLARKAAFERARGIDTQLLGPGELRALAPALAPGMAGAAFCAAEGQIDPLRGTMALLRLARQAGVRVAAGVAVTGLAREGAAWRLHTGGGVVRAGQVLNAAGAHAGAVAALAGVPLPVRAVVQQVIATAPAPPLLRQLVAQAGARLSLKQGEGGHLLVGGGWPGRMGADGATRLERRSIQGSLFTAIQALPALAGVEVVRAWTGLTVHLDRGPVLSATPGHAGLFHAVTSNGYTLGPVAGRMVAEAMLGRAGLPAAFGLG